MLNERQTQVVIRKVNEDIDIPLMSDGREGRIITKVVEKIMPRVEPSLEAILPLVYVRCIKAALNEARTIKERRNEISEMLRGELSEPLTRELNERVDVSLIPEKWEGKLLKVVSNKLIEELVEWTVGEVDEHLRVVPGSEEAEDADRGEPESEDA